MSVSTSFYDFLPTQVQSIVLTPHYPPRAVARDVVVPPVVLSPRKTPQKVVQDESSMYLPLIIPVSTHQTPSRTLSLRSQKASLTTWPATMDPTPELLGKARDYMTSHRVNDLPLSEQWEHHLTVLAMVASAFRIYAPVLTHIRDYFVRMRGRVEEDAKQWADVEVASRMEHAMLQFRNIADRLTGLHEKERGELRAQVAMLQAYRDAHSVEVEKDLTKARKDTDNTRAVVLRALDETVSLRHTVSALHDYNADLRTQLEEHKMLLTDEKRTSQFAVNSNPFMNVEFSRAAKSELDGARLSTQRVLINHASEQFLVARTLIDTQSHQMQGLHDRIVDYETEIETWKVKLHAARTENRKDGSVPGTPRPEIPYDLPQRFGIKILMRPTREIVADMIGVMDKQSENLRNNYTELRKLRRLVAWVDEGMAKRVIPADESNPTVLAYLPEADAMYEFLRVQNVASDGVPNEDWNVSKTTILIQDLFSSYERSSKKARELFEKAGDVIAAKIMKEDGNDARLQRHIVTSQAVENEPFLLPFDFVVQAFLQEKFQGGGDKAAGYNLLHWARRYAVEEPMCRLFLSVLEGSLSPNVFGTMRMICGKIRSALKGIDINQDGKIAMSIIRALFSQFFHDQPSSVWCCMQRGIHRTVHGPESSEFKGDYVMYAKLLEDGTPIIRELRRHVLNMYISMYAELETNFGEVLIDSVITSGLCLLSVPVAKDIAKKIAGRPARSWKGPPPIIDLDEWVEEVVNSSTPPMPRFHKSHAGGPDGTFVNQTLVTGGKLLRRKSSHGKGSFTRKKSCVTFMGDGADYVEWKVFLHRMRLTPLPFKDRLHVMEYNNGTLKLTE